MTATRTSRSGTTRGTWRVISAIGVSLCSALVMVTTGAVAVDDNNKVNINLRGRVAAKCTVNGGAIVSTPVSVGNVNEPGSTFTEYPINCNAPFSYTITSKNGGLQRTAPINNTRPTRLYNVNVRIPLDIGVIDDTCASDTIRSGAVTCAGIHDSGDGVALAQKAKLSVAWQATPALPAGTYSDRLTFTVALKH